MAYCTFQVCRIAVVWCVFVCVRVILEWLLGNDGEFHGAVGCEVRQWLKILIAAASAAPVSCKWKMRRSHVALFSHMKIHFRNDPYRHITCGWDAENMMVCPACGDGACFRVSEKAEEEQTWWISGWSSCGVSELYPEIKHRLHSITQSVSRTKSCYSLLSAAIKWEWEMCLVFTNSCIWNWRIVTGFFAAMSVSDLTLKFMTQKTYTDA